MDVTNYDFESKLEQGFKSLFNTVGINLYIADDVDGGLPNENVRLELSVGGAISNEHLSAGNYDNYGGSIDINIQTPRVSGDQVAISEGAARDSYVVSGAGTNAVNGLYVRNGSSFSGQAAYTLYDTDGTTALYNLWGTLATGGTLTWRISSTGIDEVPTVELYKMTINSQTPPASGWGSITGTAPAPTLAQSPPLQFKSRHAELVAIARKTMEEMDAAVLTANWPNALSPTKITPTGTERDNDAESRDTTLSYSLQFCIT